MKYKLHKDRKTNHMKKRTIYYIDNVDNPQVLRRIQPDGKSELTCNEPNNWSESVCNEQDLLSYSDIRQITKREAKRLFPLATI